MKQYGFNESITNIRQLQQYLFCLIQDNEVRDKQTIN